MAWSCLEKKIMQGTMPGARRQGRPHMAWMDKIKTWTGLPVNSQSEWQRTQINGESTSMVWPTLGLRTAKEQNRTELICISNKHMKSFRVSVCRPNYFGWRPYSYRHLFSYLLTIQEKCRSSSCCVRMSYLFLPNIYGLKITGGTFRVFATL